MSLSPPVPVTQGVSNLYLLNVLSWTQKRTIRKMRSSACQSLVVLLLLSIGSASASILPNRHKRFQLCVDVTGDFCLPGLIECCDEAGTCTIDDDGIPVRIFPHSLFEHLWYRADLLSYRPVKMTIRHVQHLKCYRVFLLLRLRCTKALPLMDNAYSSTLHIVFERASLAQRYILTCIYFFFTELDTIPVLLWNIVLRTRDRPYYPESSYDNDFTVRLGEVSTMLFVAMLTSRIPQHSNWLISVCVHPSLFYFAPIW